MNNKGFAISSILYLLILIAGILLLSTLAVITFRKDVLTSRYNAINRELEGSFVNQYRYITEGGEWSSWIDYQDKSEINHTVNIKKVPNLGTRGSQYDLNGTNLVLEIVNGDAYLKFNGTDSKGLSGTGEETVINSAILEVKKESIGGIVGFSSSTIDGFYFPGAVGYENTFRIGRDTDYLTTNVVYSNNDIYRYVVTMDKKTGSYYIYQNGSLVETTGYVDIRKITSVGLGYLRYSSNPLYLKGNIYNVTLTTGIISKEEAQEISKIGSNNNLELYGIRPEIKYEFIEYRTVDINDKNKSEDVFKTRYIKDFSNGSTLGYNPYVEIEAYARFEQYNSFKSIMIGGSHSGTYQIVTGGKVSITSGNFIHPNSSVYNTAGMEVITPYVLSTSYGSGLLLFVGSDLTRFGSFNKPFVYAEFSDRGNTGVNDWYYYNGTSWLTFVPQDDDAIVGYILKNNGSSNLDSVNLFNQSFTFNVALGKTVTSSNNTTNISRVVDGKVGLGEYFNNGSGSQNIEIDLGEEYNIIEIRIFRGKSTDNVVVYDTRTTLHNVYRTDSLVLWESIDNGLYVENPYGLGTSLYVDQSRMPKTIKTRYVEDCSNGRYLVSDNSFESVNEWREVRVFDLNGFNVALNKTVTTDVGSATNLNYVTDGSDATVYSGGSNATCIIVDLGHSYALKEANLYRNTNNYINKYIRTGIVQNNTGIITSNIYDFNKEGVYREIAGGIRVINKEESKDKNIIESADSSGASAPDLRVNMIPVRWNGFKWVKADINNYKGIYSWYDYDSKIWANAVTVIGTKRNFYQNAEAGTEVVMSDILTFFVWVPRYKYAIPTGTNPREISIVFEPKTATKSTGTALGANYYTHPAFTFGTTELNGIWVGKFEPTGTIDNITIKPGLASIREETLSDMFIATRAMQNSGNQYGFETSGIDTHMMKNNEWGAVAYLSHSKYGKNSEIWKNNSSTFITGCSGSVVSDVEFVGCQNEYTSTTGWQASTTGNIYGIYDISGGAYEYTMGNYDNTIGDSGFTSLPNEKYYDKYTGNAETICSNEKCKGHALSETSGWYNDYELYVDSTLPWFRRGGFYNDGSNYAGAFFYSRFYGKAHINYTFRIVMSNS
ncbi:MAG: hypothetical protein PHS45_03270 [Bacilli bacterium]|nr:hypothetical protein [Bacilli bacterium]